MKEYFKLVQEDGIPQTKILDDIILSQRKEIDSEIDAFCKLRNRKRSQISENAILGWRPEDKRLGYFVRNIQFVMDEHDGKLKVFEENKIKIVDIEYGYFMHRCKIEDMKQSSQGTPI